MGIAWSAKQQTFSKIRTVSGFDFQSRGLGSTVGFFRHLDVNLVSERCHLRNELLNHGILKQASIALLSIVPVFVVQTSLPVLQVL